MSHRVTKIIWYNGCRGHWCDGCAGGVLADHKFYLWSRVDLRIYCGGCVKNMDVVYDYYYEVKYDPYHVYIYYDLMTLKDHHPALTPKLTKI